MSNQPITLSGNLTGPVVLRRTQTGSLVANFRIAADRSAPGAEEGTWRSFDQIFIDVEAWGDLAYNCKSSLGKGAPVWANGYLVTRQWETKPEPGEGPKRLSKIVLKARSVAFDLNRFTVISRKSSAVIEHFTERADEVSRFEQFDRLIDQDNYRPAGGTPAANSAVAFGLPDVLHQPGDDPADEEDPAGDRPIDEAASAAVA